VILHEEAEDGNAMPDLSKPVEAVSRAVENLTRVGKETISKSEDDILRAEMPTALQRVDRASKLLEEAAFMLKGDPYSQQARNLLIEGSRGILQGTSSLLLCFDESEVRKLVRSCRKVLDYMQVVEVIEQMDDLVQFVKDLTPALSKVSKDVNLRQKELTHHEHREILLRCLENLKQEAPVLISSMKIYIQLLNNNQSVGEAAGNRNYHTQRMSDELNEIIRVLQLTTYDDDDYEWGSDSLTYIKRALGAMTSKMQSAHDWLEDPQAPNGGIGEKALRQILEHAEKIAERSLPPDREAIRKQCSDIRSMVDALAELRQDSRGASSAQAQTLARNIGQQLRELLALCTRAIANVEMGGNPQPAHTLSGRMDQAQRWLNNLHFHDYGLGEQAVQAIIDEARRLALACQLTQLRQQMLNLCNDAEQLNRQLASLCQQQGPKQEASKQAKLVARQLSMKLKELQRFIHAAMVNMVVDDFIDATLPLRQFTEVVTSSTSSTTTTTTTSSRQKQFNERAQGLRDWCKRATQTADHVALNCAQNKRLSESIRSVSSQLDSQTPQLIGAGQIRFEHPANSSATENFTHMRDHYEGCIIKLRNLIDEAIDSAAFVQASLEAIRRHTQLCEMAISTRQVQSMVDNAAAIARLANRVIMVARQETNNSEDAQFIQQVDQSTRRLQELVPQMVRHAKGVATSINDLRSHAPWRQCNQQLIDQVAQIGQALGPGEMGDLSAMFSSRHSTLNSSNSRSRQQQQTTTTTTTTTHTTLQDQYGLGGGATPPSRSSGYKSESSARASAISPAATHAHYTTNTGPPPPQQQTRQPYIQPQQAHHHQTQATPPPPQRHYQQQQYHEVATDDEEERFPTLQPNQPIMLAAHDLHQEVKQWSSKENEIIAAAKKIALLMARLSQLVRGDSGTKKDLISCAKAIAEASQEVTRLAKEQAKLCTDRKMRTNILQVCERIPTMGTQLKILSTVKATMLGVQGSQEDQEAMDMIVGNAQNLMQSIKETVRACEAASIKIRTDQGVRVRWIRKDPWYT